MAQDHDGLKGDDGPNAGTVIDEGEGVVALDGQVEQAAGEGDDEGGSEAEGDEGDDEVEADEDAADAAVARAEVDASFLRTVGRDPSMLLGAMRDHVLKGAKRTEFWGGLSEREQINYSTEVEHACKVALQGAFMIAAARDFPCMEMQITDVKKNNKRVIQAKLEAPYDLEDWRKIGEATICTLLPGTSTQEYQGALPVEIMKDQPSIFDRAETPDAKAKRERIDRDAEEREASLARARQIKPLDPAPPTIDNATGDVVADAPPAPLTVAPADPGEMTAAERVAYQRGVAHRLHGGARTLPGDLVDKDIAGNGAEAKAFFAGWNAEPAEPEPEPAPAAKPKRRGRRTVAESVADRQASLVGADARGTYEPA